MKQCAMCGKGSTMVGKRIKLRGKYNPQPLTRRHPNLQKATLADGRKALICAQCLKTLAKKYK